MHHLKAAFALDSQDPNLARALAGAVGYQDETPIFIVGLPRSGSSLVEQIIASHPQAYGAGECLSWLRCPACCDLSVGKTVPASSEALTLRQPAPERLHGVLAHAAALHPEAAGTVHAIGGFKKGARHVHACRRGYCVCAAAAGPVCDAEGGGGAQWAEQRARCGRCIRGRHACQGATSARTHASRNSSAYLQHPAKVERGV